MRRIFTLFSLIGLLLIVGCLPSFAAQVTLAWDPNEETIDGYRIFCREIGAEYNYSAPIWQGPETTATITVDDGTTWFFVVRAYLDDLESADSIEVSYVAPPLPDPDPDQSALPPNSFNPQISQQQGSIPIIIVPDIPSIYSQANAIDLPSGGQLYLPEGSTMHKLTVETPSNYIDVICDGFKIRFQTNITWTTFCVYITELDDTVVWRLTHELNDGTNAYYATYDSNRVFTIIENTPGRVVIRYSGNLDRSDGATENYLSTCDGFEIYYYIYPDMIIQDFKLSMNASQTVTASSYSGWNIGALTSPANAYENSGSESAASTWTLYNSADYLVSTGTEINHQAIVLHVDGVTNVRQESGDAGEIFLYSIDNLSAGDLRFITAHIFDSADRDGSAKLYNSTARLAIGDQWKDFVLNNTYQEPDYSDDPGGSVYRCVYPSGYTLTSEETAKYSTRTHTSLSDAISNASADDIIEILGGDSGWSSADTTNHTISISLTIRAIGLARHRGAVGSSPTHWRSRVTSGHSFTSSADLTLDGLDIGNGAPSTSGDSSECIRMTGATGLDLTVKNCLLWFENNVSNDQHDLIYLNNIGSATVTLENVMGWNANRAVIDNYSCSGTSVTINSCTFFNIGFSTMASSRSGIVGNYGDTSLDVSIFNTICHMAVGYAFTTSASDTATVNIDRCVTNTSAWINNDTDWTETITDSSLNQAIGDDTDGTDDIILETTDGLSSGADYDLRLVNHANNDAMGAHADSSGAGLTIPDKDILNSRREALNYDLGAHQISNHPTTGLNVLDNRLPLSLGRSGLAADGALHVEPDEIERAKGSRIFDGTDQYLVTTDTPINEPPLSFMAWVKPDVTNIDQVLFAISDSDSNYHEFGMKIDQLNYLEVYTRAAASVSAGTNGVQSFSTSQWNCAIGVFAAADSRIAYLNGYAGSENQQTVTPTYANIDRMAIAARARSTVSSFLDGKIAHVALWNVALDTDDVAALSAGADPRTVKPNNLLCYWPLIDDDDDLVGIHDMAPQNTPTWSTEDYPDVAYPPSSYSSKLTFDRTRYNQSVVIHSASFQTGTVSSPVEHLVGHWKMDDNAASTAIAAEVGSNGTASTNTSNLSDTDAIRGRAFNLVAASSETLELPISFGDKNVFTIMFQAKMNFDYDTAQAHPLVYVWASDTDRIGVYYHNAYDEFCIYNDLTNAGQVHYNNDGMTTDYIQQWHDFMFVVDLDNDVVELWIDGALNLTGLVTEAWTGTPTKLLVGKSQSASGTADINIENIRAYDGRICPYGGGPFLTNDGSDYSNAHGDVTCYVKGDESSGDNLKVSVNGTDDITVTGAGHATSVTGEANAAFSFGDVSSDVVTIPSANLNLAKGSVQFWFKSTAAAPTNYEIFFGSHADWWTKFTIYMGSDGNFSFNYNGENDNITPTIDIFDQTWHHVRWTWDSANNSRKLYIDGQLQGEITAAITTPTYTADLRIGNGNLGSDDLDGDMCEIIFTDDPNTPDLWSVYGKPRLLPLLEVTD